MCVCVFGCIRINVLEGGLANKTDVRKPGRKGKTGRSKDGWLDLWSAISVFKSLPALYYLK